MIYTKYSELSDVKLGDLQVYEVMLGDKVLWSTPRPAYWRYIRFTPVEAPIVIKGIKVIDLDGEEVTEGHIYANRMESSGSLKSNYAMFYRKPIITVDLGSLLRLSKVVFNASVEGTIEVSIDNNKWVPVIDGNIPEYEEGVTT